MPRVAFYARYSSDRQHERSIEDQLRDLTAKAEREGWTVVETYCDYAVSGAHAGNRPALQQLLADAAARRFDVVLAEGLDRLSRSQRDVADIHERLTFAEVRLMTLSEGEVSELHVGLKGTMNALELKALANRVRRGQRGRIHDKLSAGGLPYGYRVVRELDARGEPVRGKREIDAEQAEVIRRIFAAYVAGESPRAIARRLNDEGVPPPRGTKWNASTINGHRTRRYGILCNELYVGFLIWNRQRFVKDPATGKRIGRLNPREEWIVVEVPELAIVDRELWDAAQTRKAAYDGRAVHRTRRPKHLLSGLARCGVCGGGYVIRSRDYLGCATYRESGSCDNDRRIRVGELERRVLDGLKHRLLSPEAMAEFAREYRSEMERRRKTRTRDTRRTEKRLAELNREIERLVDAICDGTATPAMRKRLEEREAEKAGLEREQAAAEQSENGADVVPLHPNLPELYRRKVAELETALKDDATKAEAVEILRSMVDHIAIHPRRTANTGVDIELHGQLAAIINTARPENSRPGRARTVLVVAGEGLEPPTHGL
ncbi:recombinase family protein [Ferruginivarius sediminum]|uniref:Recombinase family protein n=1 Tax=Ferruginivarius sediminum TaxID=2661937 RepID=A0A369T5G8_9PROT|nr:recombinase family protein [Ferruginivarius sediminum]